jgi:hypothetical protein
LPKVALHLYVEHARPQGETVSLGQLLEAAGRTEISGVELLAGRADTAASAGLDQLAHSLKSPRPNNQPKLPSRAS